MSGKGIHETNSVKYLRPTIDKNLTLKEKIRNVAMKLCVIYKQTLKSTDLANFVSNVCCASLVLTDNFSSAKTCCKRKQLDCCSCRILLFSREDCYLKLFVD